MISSWEEIRGCESDFANSTGAEDIFVIVNSEMSWWEWLKLDKKIWSNI